MRNIGALLLSLFVCLQVLASTENAAPCNVGVEKSSHTTVFHNDPDYDTIATKYRMYNRQQFKVLDTAVIWMYQYQTKIVDMVRVSAKSTKVVNKTVTDYYFSLNGQSELFQLTLSDIKLLFLFNKTYFQELCLAFKSTESLLAKSEKGTFLLNDFLKEAKRRGLTIDN